ncbi:hypothetical protein V6N13_046953 [Hibiscus sabdariffa]
MLEVITKLSECASQIGSGILGVGSISGLAPRLAENQTPNSETSKATRIPTSHRRRQLVAETGTARVAHNSDHNHSNKKYQD